MGTMSRYQHPQFGISRTRLVKATEARRELVGQRLVDVLTVINQRHSFNRKCRRIVFSRWRKHCRFKRIGIAEGLKEFDGQIANQDSPGAVQLRILSHAL